MVDVTMGMGEVQDKPRKKIGGLGYAFLDYISHMGEKAKAFDPRLKHMDVYADFEKRSGFNVHKVLSDLVGIDPENETQIAYRYPNPAAKGVGIKVGTIAFDSADEAKSYLEKLYDALCSSILHSYDSSVAARESAVVPDAELQRGSLEGVLERAPETKRDIALSDLGGIDDGEFEELVADTNPDLAEERRELRAELIEPNEADVILGDQSDSIDKSGNGSEITSEEIDAIKAVFNTPDEASFDATLGPNNVFSNKNETARARGVVEAFFDAHPELSIEDVEYKKDDHGQAFHVKGQAYDLDLDGVSVIGFGQYVSAIQGTMSAIKHDLPLGRADAHEGLSAREVAAVSGAPVKESAWNKVFNVWDLVKAQAAPKQSHGVVEKMDRCVHGARSGVEAPADGVETDAYEARKAWAKMLRGYATSDPVGHEPSETLGGEARKKAEDVENVLMTSLKERGMGYERMSHAEVQDDKLVIYDVRSGLPSPAIDFAGQAQEKDVAEVLNNNIHKDYYERRDAHKSKIAPGHHLILAS